MRVPILSHCPWCDNPVKVHKGKLTAHQNDGDLCPGKGQEVKFRPSEPGMKRVYVSSNEGVRGGGGFFWFAVENHAVRDFNDTVENGPADTIAYLFTVDVPADMRNASITEYIADRLEELQCAAPIRRHTTARTKELHNRRQRSAKA